jgi:F-type H+-transporting ATPase subunit c
MSFPRTSTQQPNLLVLWLPQLVWQDQGLALAQCLIIGYARNQSLKQQLFSYAMLGFALSEAMGLFCLMVAFLILFAM